MRAHMRACLYDLFPGLFPWNEVGNNVAYPAWEATIVVL